MIVDVNTDPEFKKVLESNEKVVVKYSADWCGHCRLLTPKFNRMSEEERFKDVMFVRMDIEENPKAKSLLSDLGVEDIETIPYIITLKNGVLVEAKSTSKEKAIVAMIERLRKHTHPRL